MTFEFLIACHAASDDDVHEVLTDLLSEALENNREEHDEDSIRQTIQFRHQRRGGEIVDAAGESTCHLLIGFTLDLSETGSAGSVVNDFAESLLESPRIIHAIKFEDPLLKHDLDQRAIEIFALEMKLRRVLSFIYLHAYQSDAPYDLFREEQVKPVTPQLNSEQMRAAIENQFFHLTFSQYRNLNERRAPSLPDILRIIGDSKHYDALRDKITRITRSPILNEQDTDLLNDLKELVNSIEGMRNCVAHNRKPSNSIRQNYPRARSELESRLDAYLASLEC
ncbi:MAG: hypothetical protein OXG11_01330 [Chloroflexi bacterium]|nr:hypothetical protein [Chloroflexota bacterium]